MTKDWVHGVGHSPVCQILLQIVVTAVITYSQPTWTSSAGMLLTPANFPFLNDCLVASTSLWRMGWSSSVCLGTVQYWWISIGLVVVQLRVVFCPLVQYLLLFCEAFSWPILDSSHFPLFHSGQVFHQLVCPLTVVLPQIFSNLTTLFSYEVFWSLFRAPLCFFQPKKNTHTKQILFQQCTGLCGAVEHGNTGLVLITAHCSLNIYFTDILNPHLTLPPHLSLNYQGPWGITDDSQSWIHILKNAPTLAI